MPKEERHDPVDGTSAGGKAGGSTVATVFRYRQQWASAARLLAWLGAAVFVMGAASCPNPTVLNMDTGFSVNLARPAATWPRLDRLSLAEIEAYEQHGKPDYFRIWYSHRDEITSKWEASPILRRKSVSGLPRSWVYEEKKIELRFPSPSKFEEVPLSDKLQVLCHRGDPQDRPDIQTLKSGAIRESWMYYDVGEKYIFLDGHLARKQVFTPMGRPFQRL